MKAAAVNPHEKRDAKPAPGAESKPDEKAEAKAAPKHARLLVVLAIAMTAGAGFWLVSTGRIGQRPPPSNSITLYGNVDIRQVELGFRVFGRLKAMRFEEGESVDAGAVMAELDLRSFDDQLQAAEAQAAANEANLKKVVTGSRPAEIARAKAALDEATAGQQNARTELARTEKLVADNAVPRANYDTARAASREADARVASANESLGLLVQGSRAEDVAAANATVAVAQASLAAAQTSIDDARLVAPSDGVVISRVKEPGAIVSTPMRGFARACPSPFTSRRVPAMESEQCPIPSFASIA